MSLLKLSPVLKDPEILGGTPCFRGTRVPVRILYEYLEAGDPLSAFLDQFPTVSRDAAISVLELGRFAAEEDAATA